MDWVRVGFKNLTERPLAILYLEKNGQWFLRLKITTGLERAARKIEESTQKGKNKMKDSVEQQNAQTEIDKQIH